MKAQDSSKVLETRATNDVWDLPVRVFHWLMVLSFAAVLLVPNLAVIVIAQLVFGLAVGLIYYSSLFYSMDVGDTKGEHGGFHEALIGVGLFAGPAVGAGTLLLYPAAPNAGIWAVSGLLVIGLIGLASDFAFKAFNRHLFPWAQIDR